MLGKTQLLEAIAGKNRGLLASEPDKQAILAAIARLEDLNPTAQPTSAAPLLDGNWRLLYTTSTELLGLDQIPLFRLGQIYQWVQASEGKIYNIAEIYGLPWVETLVSVAARFEAVNERRVKVTFERAVFGLQRLIGYESPAQFIQALNQNQRFLAIDFSLANREQRGWLDITYLDEDLRIGRGNEGSVFVLSKV